MVVPATWVSLLVSIFTFISIRKSKVDLLVDCLGSGAGVSTRTFRDAQRGSSVAGELPIWQLSAESALSYSGNYALSIVLLWPEHWQLCLLQHFRATVGWVLSCKDRLTLLCVVNLSYICCIINFKCWHTSTETPHFEKILEIPRDVPFAGELP